VVQVDLEPNAILPEVEDPSSANGLERTRGRAPGRAEETGQDRRPAGDVLPQRSSGDRVDVGDLEQVRAKWSKPLADEEGLESPEQFIELLAQRDIAWVGLLSLPPVQDEPAILQLEPSIPRSIRGPEPEECRRRRVRDPEPAAGPEIFTVGRLRGLPQGRYFDQRRPIRAE